MITVLKDVISTIEKLQDEEHIEIAKLLNDEMRWDHCLRDSKEKLNSLAHEALLNIKLLLNENNRSSYTFGRYVPRR